MSSARDLPAISVRQPHAWLIVSGAKDIENRPRRRSYRGRVLIHASLTHEHEAEVLGEPLPAEFWYGGIVGVVEIADCVTRHRSRWFTGPHGFVVRYARPRRFRRCNGGLGVFYPDDSQCSPRAGRRVP